MIRLGLSALKVYLAVEPCDMRKGFNGLTTAAVEHLGQPLAHDALFVFINKRRSRVKLLCFARVTFPRGRRCNCSIR